jgi:hypothetical protein
VFAFEDCDLLPKNGVLKQEAGMASESSKDSAEQESKNSEHPSVLTWIVCGMQLVCC